VLALQAPEPLAQRPGTGRAPDAVPADELISGELHDMAAAALDVDALPSREVDQQGIGAVAHRFSRRAWSGAAGAAPW